MDKFRSSLMDIQRRCKSQVDHAWSFQNCPDSILPLAFIKSIIVFIPSLSILSAFASERPLIASNAFRGVYATASTVW